SGGRITEEKVGVRVAGAAAIGGAGRKVRREADRCARMNIQTLTVERHPRAGLEDMSATREGEAVEQLVFPAVSGLWRGRVVAKCADAADRRDRHSPVARVIAEPLNTEHAGVVDVLVLRHPSLVQRR